MKTYILSSIFLMLTLFSTANLKAQQIDIDKNNYVVLITKMGHFKPVFMTAEILKTEDGDNFGDFQIVLYGKEVIDIANSKIMDGIIAQSEKFGVQIAVCEMALKKFNVDMSKINKKIKIVPNAFLYNFQLQNEGFKSLSL